MIYSSVLFLLIYIVYKNTNSKKTVIEFLNQQLLGRFLGKKILNFKEDNERLPKISEWWSKGKGKCISKEYKYDVIKDYNLNIKNIISFYNSFLIFKKHNIIKKN